MAVRILVVEDDRHSREIIDAVLGASGYVAMLATDGEEGIRIAELLQVDLVLLDIHLPGADGYDVAAMLRRSPALRNARIVAVTASAYEDRERILAAGFDACIAKPIDPETFVAQIEEFLRPR